MESLKETLKKINIKLCAEASTRAFMQAVGKKNIAASILFEDFNHLETKLRTPHNTEKEMLKPKVTSEHSKWHSISNQALEAILEQWINSNHNME